MTIAPRVTAPTPAVEAPAAAGPEARPRPARWRSLLRAMRPQQWVKNLLVLAPLLFAQQLFAGFAVARALAAFALFCLVSSSIYLINDVKDVAQDRLHPRKRGRPIAAGEVSTTAAGAVAVV